MYPVSANFTPGLSDSSTTIASYVNVLSNGAVIFKGLTAYRGQITIDRKNDHRRVCSLALADPTGTLTPKSAGDLLSPYGNEIAIYRGVYYAPGASINFPALYVAGKYELVPVGVFRISTALVIDSSSGELSIEIRGYDRSRSVERADFQDTYQIATGTNVNTAIASIVQPRVPSTVTLGFPPTSIRTPLMVHGISDTTTPWAVCKQLAALLGNQIFFDANGNCAMVAEPLPGQYGEVASFIEGTRSPLLMVKREGTDERVFNDIIVHNESTSATNSVRGRAYDNDPTSPTYVGGPYGDIVKHIRSPLASDSSVAQAMAVSYLRAYLGKLDQIALTTLVNPALDVNDVIRVTRAKSGIDGRYIIDSIDLPMSESEFMTMNVRYASSAAIATTA